MRGALEGIRHIDGGGGIIPAHAGSTLGVAMPASLRRDHPRTCGEHSSTFRVLSEFPGSSPHMRGAHLVHDLPQGRHGIIPAHAGSTRSSASEQRDTTGSSPHMRGARLERGLRRRGRRIIPAHAGSTLVVDGHGLVSPDHPRICGEHYQQMLAFDPEEGSSPHMRGARAAGGRGPHRRRIIPAHAGSTRRPYRRRSPGPDHPRTCGEHTVSRSTPDSWPGSSPHMRGAPPIHETGHLRLGIIPAHAGSTGWSRRWTTTTRDHPRTCGEHKLVADGRLYQGSSPHMRGAHDVSDPPGDAVRIIPAHAGST